MIPQETIQNILETARIDEVVGDFVILKKRGVNYVGLCPFHNEKTPSFTVSPTKGIYKCFGCGKAGNSVNFVMEHEHYSYPEALRHLAKKYNIEIEEEQQTPEDLLLLSEKESLYAVSSYAQKYFSENLLSNDEGKAIGLSYFKERGFTDETIKKFLLGYSLDKWDDFTEHALKNGFKIEYLIKSGFSISKENQYYDRFRSRVMFPIHNLSGRVLGFGGRILTSDQSKPKYVNSPESEIYNKSKILYGLYFAKNSIVAQENCYLVEGYTDVISMHQAGIENVVASSGTSLTVDQIKLIKRYTPNITILYDGDAAGIKASFRGIDMILEQGMNVKVVLFPGGEDPDSYARKHSAHEVREFLAGSANDFIYFKIKLLLSESNNDPVKRASIIKEFIETIALIPDPLIRGEYIKETWEMLDVSQQTLMNELNKALRKKFLNKYIPTEGIITEPLEYKYEKQLEVEVNESEYQERDIVRLLLNYGSKEILMDHIEEDGKRVQTPIKVAEFIVNDILSDEIKFNNADYQAIFNEYATGVEKKLIPDEKYFVNHRDSKVATLSIDLVSSPYVLSKNWEIKSKIFTTLEEQVLKVAVEESILSFKSKRVNQMILENLKELKNIKTEEDRIIIQQKHITLQEIRNKINNKLGRIVIR